LLREQLCQSRDRLLDGLKKLNDTNELVHSMKGDLARLQPVLEVKASASAELLVKVISSFGLPPAHVAHLLFHGCISMVQPCLQQTAHGLQEVQD
jgi:hypothetical protein